MTLCSISQLQAKTLYGVRSLTSIHLSNHHCCGALPPFSSYHPLLWTISRSSIPRYAINWSVTAVGGGGGGGGVEIKPLLQVEAPAREDEIR